MRAFSAFLAGLFAAAGATDAPLSPLEMQKRMGMGINLGNRIDLWSQKKYVGRVKETFFDEYKKHNFTNVRIPVCWHMRTAKTEPYAIDEDFLSTVEQMVDWSLDRGMVTILNTHHEKWLDDPKKFEEGLPRFKAIWTQIAARFKSRSQFLLFEIFNEAHLMSVDQLNAMNAAILPIIRETNPTRIVFIQGLKFGNPSWILQNGTSLMIPDDPQLMLEIHNYDPYAYAGANPTQRSWGSDSDREALSGWMDGVDAWASARHLPIYYGEFGVTVAQTSETGRDAWFKAHYEGILRLGWAASVWNDGHLHLIFDYNAQTWDEQILQDLDRVPVPASVNIAV